MEEKRLKNEIKYNNIKYWVDEAIWGHRLYNEQTPWLCFMEFLTVLNSRIEEDKAFDEDESNGFSYSANKRLYLRNILFNNPILEIIESENDKNQQWDRWIDFMNRNHGGFGESTVNFSYLKNRFNSFQDFVEVVRFLRAQIVEGQNNKRWSSQFIFPYGPACLYEDLSIEKNNGSSNDRRFFARTGELLYLMLTRSGKGKEILPYFKEGVLDNRNKFNLLVSMLEKTEVDKHQSRKTGGYLPYKYLPEYEMLANDWINLFQCEMGKFDILPYLITITGLHMIIYFLNRSNEELKQKNATFVLEIVAPKKTAIRDLASNSYSDNHNLSKLAIEQYIYSIKDSPEWKKALESDDPTESAFKLVEEIFAWETKTSFNSPDEILDDLYGGVLKRHKQHLQTFHSAWTREIGLSSKRGSRRTRYAPSDSFLKSLVLCTVPKRMEFQEFLEKLYQKYGFIIGDKQAKQIVDKGLVDQITFIDNAKRLESRLESMGLLKRLSDARAYVENPFTRREN